MKAHEVMSRNVTAIAPSAKISEAHELMRSSGSRHVTVAVRDRLVGMLSDRDILPFTRDGVVTSDLRVDEVMSAPPIVADRETTLPRIAGRMLEYQIDAIPIVEGERLVGIVTTADLLILINEGTPC
jgi:CBS domain-containing protein